MLVTDEELLELWRRQHRARLNMLEGMIANLNPATDRDRRTKERVERYIAEWRKELEEAKH
jgi:hypothetical protein